MTAPARPHTAVFGIGSPAGDDRAGWLVIDALRARLAPPPAGVLLEALDRPGPALLVRLAGLQQAILVDAIVTGGRAGAVRVLDLDAVLALPARPVSSHGMGLAATLATGHALGDLPPLVVFGIEAAEWQPGSEAGAAVRAGVEAAARAIADLLRA